MRKVINLFFVFPPPKKNIRKSYLKKKDGRFRIRYQFSFVTIILSIEMFI